MKMVRSVGFALGLIVLALISMPDITRAFKQLRPFKPFKPCPRKIREPKKIIVGGSEHWRYGYNYTDWAIKNGPFYQNDTLVFMYDPPTDAIHPHSVYLLKDHQSFMKCDFNESALVANVYQGGGAGFEFVLKVSKPHYFGCPEHELLHCLQGQMKFFVRSIPRCHV